MHWQTKQTYQRRYSYSGSSAWHNVRLRASVLCVFFRIIQAKRSKDFRENHFHLCLHSLFFARHYRIRMSSWQFCILFVVRGGWTSQGSGSADEKEYHTTARSSCWIDHRYIFYSYPIQVESNGAATQTTTVEVHVLLAHFNKTILLTSP